MGQQLQGHGGHRKFAGLDLNGKLIFVRLFFSIDPLIQVTDDDDDIFADLDRRVNVVATTEPTAYINADPDYSGACADPIKFWSDKHGDRFARFALDFVSAPGKFHVRYLNESIHISSLLTATSVDVERAFSRGSLTVSKYRHALSDESTRAAVVLRAWSEVPGIVIDKDIQRLFEEKCRRSKTNVATTSTDAIVID